MSFLGTLGRSVATAFGVWAAWRIFGPEMPRRHQATQTRPLRVPGRTVLVGEREFFVRETGPADGPVLVLIHGWSLDAEMTFFRIVPDLADRYRVVMPDLRNHGHSDWIRGKYEVAELADEVAGVLDALDVRAATVLGYSLGGMVAQELARRHPHVVGQLVLGGTAARPVPALRGLARVGFWLGRAAARISTREGALITTTVLRRTGALERDHERWMYEALLRRDADLFYEAGFAAVRFDSRDWIGKLSVPITVVIPSRDILVPAAAQRDLARRIPGARVVELPGSGHEAVLTRSEEIVKVLHEVMAAS